MQQKWDCNSTMKLLDEEKDAATQGMDKQTANDTHQGQWRFHQASIKESIATEAIQAVHYERTNLKEVTKKCKKLIQEQQVKPLSMLK